ncbi:MAG: hypothetical protein ACJA13_000552 [Paraglaciecola sp.]|jgi:hypothetical protein
MNTGHENDTTTEGSTSDSRRKFLQKTTAGVVISSLPATSVWAQSGGGGILNSIVASTHASGWTDGQMALLSQGYWGSKHGIDRSKAVTFETAFHIGAEPLLDSGKAEWRTDGNLWAKHGGTWENTDIEKASLTLYDVVSNTNYMDNVSVQIAAMYLNAKHHGEDNLNFPVYDTYTLRPFGSLDLYADWLYANINTAGFGSALELLISENHAPK